jgi:hypothetical protein
MPPGVKSRGCDGPGASGTPPGTDGLRHRDSLNSGAMTIVLNSNATVIVPSLRIFDSGRASAGS